MTDPRRPARDVSCDEVRDLAPLYVLGALERDEEAAVRTHLETCGEPHPEVDELGGVVPALLEVGVEELVEPPAALGARIMAAAAADLASGRVRRVGTADETGSTGAIPFPDATERAERAASAERTAGAERTGGTDGAVRRDRRAGSRGSALDWIVRIAAVVAIVALGAWGLNLQAQLDHARAFDSAVAAVVQAGGQPGAKTVVLSPADGHQGSGIAAVARDGSVVLAMRDLPATTGSQVYTTWVIVGDQPTAVGDFGVDSSGVRGFTTRPFDTPAGATVALTLEPNPGNTAPKGPVVSAGVAAAPPGANG